MGLLVDDGPLALWRIEEGHVLDKLREMPGKHFQCCVTSPPYYGLRDYKLEPSEWGDGWSGCLGLEPTPEMYVGHLVEVFSEVFRVLRDDGLLWIVIGDSYASTGTTRWPNTSDGYGNGYGKHGAWHGGEKLRPSSGSAKAKDLLMIPAQVALALRADGWYLRDDVIWAKPNPMPGSQKDRCTSSYEHVLMFSKKARYYFDYVAIREPDKGTDHKNRNVLNGQPSLEPTNGLMGEHSGLRTVNGRNGSGRTKRNVWNVATVPFSAESLGIFRLDRVESDAVDDGTKRIESPDCPVHVGQVDLESKVSYGVRVGDSTIHIVDNDDDLVLAQLAERGSIVRIHELSFEIENSDSIPRECALVANSRNTENHKTVLDLETNQTCMPFDETSAHTGGTSIPLEFDELHLGMHENRSESCDSDVLRESQSVDGIDHKSFLSVDSACICEYYHVGKVDHFAVFPPKLIEPMVLAGSAQQSCSECGAPWKRVVEHGKMEWREGPTHDLAETFAALDSSLTRTALRGTMTKAPTTTTIGWESTCKHDDGEDRSTILDPFAGAGTTGVVALQHGRHFVGIEQSSEFCEMARGRIAKNAPINSAPDIYDRLLPDRLRVTTSREEKR